MKNILLAGLSRTAWGYGLLAALLALPTVAQAYDTPWPAQYAKLNGAALTPGVELPGPDGFVYPDFRYAGIYWGKPSIPVVRTAPVPNGVDDTAVLQGLIDDLSDNEPDGGVILLQAGTYRVSTSLVINKSRTILRGQGPNQTTILATDNFSPQGAPNGAGQGIICFYGPGSSGQRITLGEDFVRGDRTLVLTSNAPSDLQPGDFIEVFMKEWDSAPSLGGDAWGERYPIPFGNTSITVRQHFIVESVSGSTITVFQPNRHEMLYTTTGSSSAFKERFPLRYCGVEDLTIRQSTANNQNVDCIAFWEIYACWFDNLKLINGARGPIFGYRALNIEITNCQFINEDNGSGDGVRSYGSNREGYAGFGDTHNSLMQNVTAVGLRHGPAWQSGASGNVISNCDFATSDINWHNQYVHENLLELSICDNTNMLFGSESYYNQASYTSNYDGSLHGPEGPQNVMYNNDIKVGQFYGPFGWSPAGVGLHGFMEAWMIMYNDFDIYAGPGIFSREGSFDMRVVGNVWQLRSNGFGSAQPGRPNTEVFVTNPPLIYLTHTNQAGVTFNPYYHTGYIIEDNRTYGGSGQLFGGPAAPGAGLVTDNNQFFAFQESPTPASAPTPSLWQWQIQQYGLPAAPPGQDPPDQLPGADETYSFEAESTPATSNITIQPISDGNLRGDAGAFLNTGAGNGSYIEFTINIPTGKAGEYRIVYGYKGYASRGIVSLTVDGFQVGQNRDHYTPNDFYGSFDQGVWSFTEGSHSIRFTIVGKNTSSTGYKMMLDYIDLIGTGTGPQPAEVVVKEGTITIADGSSVSFGTTSVGNPLTKIYSIENTGDSDLTIGTVTVPSGFSVTTAPAATVTSGSSTSLAVRLDATTAGVYAGGLSFATNDTDENPFNLILSGTVSASGGTPPTIATAASASNVTATTADLSVLGSDDGGEASLIYTWSTVTKPAGASDPTFSVNGTNAAKNTTATFAEAGNYTLRAAVTDVGSQSATSDAGVTITAVLSDITVSPQTATVVYNTTANFNATGTDQFGDAMSFSPTWSVDGGGAGGTVSAGGLYTAPSASGTDVVRATVGSISDSASVSVVPVQTADIYEPFAYATGSLSGASGSGSGGFSGAWTAATGHSVVAPGYTAANLDVGGNRMSTLPDFGNWARRPLSNPISTSGTSEVWVSVIASHVSGSTTGAQAGIGLFNGTNLFADGISLGASFNDSSNWGIGVSGSGFYASNVPVSSTPRLLVLRIRFQSGNDRFTLWVDPVPGELPEDSSANYDGSPFNVSYPSLTYLTAFSGIPWQSSTAVFSFDEFRLGPDANSVLPGYTAPADLPPTVATAASIGSQTATTANLNVLGADDNGEANLTYTWSTVSSPQGAPAVSFSANGNNVAKATTATFGAVGDYTLRATITDAVPQATSSDVNVTVAVDPSSVTVTPASVSVLTNETQAFSASVLDQFGTAASVTVSWTVVAGGVGGSISGAGLYTAPGAGGMDTVRATVGSISDDASVTVVVPTYPLTVNSGTGDGSYTAGSVISIVADAPPTGQQFDTWTGDTAFVNSVTSSNTIVTMPAQAVNVSATYEEILTYALTVNSGSGDGSYEAGTVVNITADAPPSGQQFDVWTGDTAYVASVESASTSVTMPASTLTVTATYENVLADPSLKLHLPFDDGSGTTATDASGNGYNATLSVTGATWGTDFVQLTPQASENGGHVILPAANDLYPSEITIAFWVNPVSWNSATFLVKASNYSLAPTSGGLVFDANGIGPVTCSVQPALNTWTHVAITIGSGVRQFYVNGQAVSTSGSSGQIYSGSVLQILVGTTNVSGTPDRFNGALDDLRIYSRPLSGSEVLDLYQAGR